MATCFGRHMAPLRTTCSRRRWSYARRGRGGIHHHEDSIARDSTTSQNPNDIRGADVAYTKMRNVCARSCAAVERTTDQLLLAEVAKNDKDHGVGKGALRRITDLSVIADIAKNSAASGTRLAAVKRIWDQAILTEIARSDKDHDVAKAALRRIANESVVADIAKSRGENNISTISVEDEVWRCMRARNWKAVVKFGACAIEPLLSELDFVNPPNVASPDLSSWNAESIDPLKEIFSLDMNRALLTDEIIQKVRSTKLRCLLCHGSGFEDQTEDDIYHGADPSVCRECGGRGYHACQFPEMTGA
jgi:hypothetical protein